MYRKRTCSGVSMVTAVSSGSHASPSRFCSTLTTCTVSTISRLSGPRTRDVRDYHGRTPVDPYNPYMPPAEAAAPVEPLVGPEATTGVRFLTFVVDQFAVAATASSVVLIMTLFGSNIILTNPSLGGIASWLFGPAYYVVFEAAT